MLKIVHYFCGKDYKKILKITNFLIVFYLSTTYKKGGDRDAKNKNCYC